MINLYRAKNETGSPDLNLRSNSHSNIKLLNQPKVIKLDDKLQRSSYRVSYTQQPNPDYGFETMSQKSNFKPQKFNKYSNSQSRMKNSMQGDNLVQFSKILADQNFLRKTQKLLQNTKIGSQSFQHKEVKESAKKHLTQLDEDLREQLKQNREIEKKNREMDSQMNQLRDQLNHKEIVIKQLQKELENLRNVEEKMEELEFKLKNTETERDLHHQSHMQLRQENQNKQNQDFQINNLKREVHYLKEENKELIEYKSQVEEQISELLVMVEKPRTEKQTTTENYYTKKIVEKDQEIKRLQEIVFQLENFQNEGKTGQGNSLLQIKLDSLEKENKMLKKKMENQGGLKMTFGADRSQQLFSEIQQLQEENQRLREQSYVDDSQKDRVIQDLKAELQILQMKNNTGGEDLSEIMETNKRLNMEIDQLNDQLRRTEEQNRKLIQENFQQLIQQNGRRRF